MLEPRSFSINDVKGRQVIDANGDNVGTVEDVAIDPQSWKVSGLVVGLRREVAERLDIVGQRGGARWLGGGPTVEIRTERIRSVGDNIILNIDRDAIAEALRHGEPPTYAGAPEYRSQAEPGTAAGPDVYPPAQPHQREGPPGF
jgi:sporulation protein YlmC with PRC-barrel domain